MVSLILYLTWQALQSCRCLSEPWQPLESTARGPTESEGGRESIMASIIAPQLARGKWLAPLCPVAERTWTGSCSWQREGNEEATQNRFFKGEWWIPNNAHSDKYITNTENIRRPYNTDTPSIRSLRCGFYGRPRVPLPLAACNVSLRASSSTRPPGEAHREGVSSWWRPFPTTWTSPRKKRRFWNSGRGLTPFIRAWGSQKTDQSTPSTTDLHSPQVCLTTATFSLGLSK